MTALDAARFAAHARAHLAQAQTLLRRHVASAYTGCCVACGRAAPCPARTAAQHVLTRFSAASADAADPGAGGREAARRAVETARRALDTLRGAQLCLDGAVARVRHTVAHSGLSMPAAAARRWSGALPLLARVAATVGEVADEAGRRAAPTTDAVLPLRSALSQARRATAALLGLRHAARLAERRLTRAAGDDPGLRAAAAHWGNVERQLATLTARLAVGTRALEAYLDGAVGGVDREAVRRARLTRLAPLLRQPDAEATLDAARLARLVAPAPRRGGNATAPWRWGGRR